MELADPGGSSSLVSLAKDAGTAGVDAPYHTELAGGYTPPCGVDFPTYVNALTDFLALMSALDTAIGTVGLRVSNIVPHVDALSLDVFLPSDIIITTILQSEV
jgi:hypothetical protein